MCVLISERSADQKNHDNNGRTMTEDFELKTPPFDRSKFVCRGQYLSQDFSSNQFMSSRCCRCYAPNPNVAAQNSEKKRFLQVQILHLSGSSKNSEMSLAFCHAAAAARKQYFSFPSFFSTHLKAGRIACFPSWCLKMLESCSLLQLMNENMTTDFFQKVWAQKLETLPFLLHICLNARAKVNKNFV